MKSSSKHLISLTLATIASLFSPLVHADTPATPPIDALQQLIDVLHKNGTLDAKTHKSLNEALRESTKTAAAESVTTTTAASAPVADMPKIDTNGRFQITSSDGNSSFRVGGRLHMDGSIYDNDSNTDLETGFDARRARLEFQATMYKYWDWKLDYEFAQTSEVKGGFRDALVRYRIPDTTSSLLIGQFKEFFGLEHMNSSNDLPFVERALPSRVFHDLAEASDGRRIGLGWTVNDKELLTLALGAFARNISGDSSDESGDPFSLQTRVTLSPMHEKGHAIHTGLSANWIDLNDPARGKLSSRPEARIGAHPLIQTGEISNADSFSRYGAELGFVHNALWSQSEYMVANFDRNEDPTVWFDGWYSSVGYILTGESRVYDFERGTFRNPVPASGFNDGGWGAWELGARLSGLNLSDEDVRGGRESNFSSGINWYPNNNFRFMFTWTRVLDVTGGEFDGASPNEFLLRTQFAF